MREYTYDVCVCGGGFAGAAAALAAARSGALVCLLEKGYVLGGLGTAGAIAIYLPLDDGDGELMSAGIAEELLLLSKKYAPVTRLPEEWERPASASERAGKRYQAEYSPGAMILALEELLVEEGVDLYYDAHVTGVEAEGGRVLSVTVSGKEGPIAFRASSFVDATGDADVCFFAGEETFDSGRNVATGWHYTYDGRDLRLRMVSDPIWAEALPEGHRFYRGTTLEDITQSCLDGRRMIRERGREDGSWPFHVPAFHGLRMTRRLKKPFEFSEEEHERVWFTDAVGMIGNWKKPHLRYSIPYSAITGEKCSNLFAAGRCCAAVGLGWDLLRVIPSCSVTGQAAGTAAAWVARAGKRPAAPELQEALRAAGVRLEPGLFARALEDPCLPE